MTDGKYIRPSALAKELRVPRGTIYRWLYEGKLKGLRMGNHKAVRILLSSVTQIDSPTIPNLDAVIQSEEELHTLLEEVNADQASLEAFQEKLDEFEDRVVNHPLCEDDELGATDDLVLTTAEMVVELGKEIAKLKEGQ